MEVPSIQGRLNSSLSRFDIISILTPAITMLAGIVLYLMIVNPAALDLLINFAKSNHSKLSVAFPNTIVMSAVYLLFLIVILYMVGQIIASISALLLDRFLIAQCLGYPYEHLLKVAPTDDAAAKSRPHETEPTVSCGARLASTQDAGRRGTFGGGVTDRERVNTKRSLNTSVVAILLVWLCFSLFIDGLWLFFVIILLVIMAINTGFTIKLAIRKEIRDKLKARKQLWDIAKKFRVWIPKLATLPGVSLLAIIKLFFNVFKLNKPLSKSLRVKIEDSFSLFGLKYDDVSGLETDLFWMPYIFVELQSKDIRGVLEYARRVYTFCRNLSATFFCILLFIVLIRSPAPDIESLGVSENHMFFVIVTITLGVTFFVRFYYLYCVYFTKLIYRSFCLKDFALNLGASPPAEQS